MFRVKTPLSQANVNQSQRKGLLTALVLLTSSSLVMLAGCGIGGAPVSNTNGMAIQGKVYGGQQPVNGATIQLYAANTSSYAGAATPLLTSTVTTGGSGDFSITGDYTCPANSQVYIVATGGNPGGFSTNAQLTLAAGLGTCSGTLSSSLFIDIDEVTTVATAYALAPFATDYLHVGTSSTNANGLLNAMATINNMVNISNGTALTQTPYYANNTVTGSTASSYSSVVPQSEINTLADILSGCVNSNGGTGNGTSCGTLFSAVAGTTPTNTFDAMLRIAQNPGSKVSNVWATLPSSIGQPFQPVLSAQPNDWSMSITYVGGGLGATTATNRSVAQNIAVDQLGDIWVTALGRNAAGGRLVELSPLGAPLTATTTSTQNGGVTPGSYQPGMLAIDSQNNVYSYYSNGGVIYKYSNGFTSLVTQSSLGQGLSTDSNDNLWAVSTSGSNQLFEYNSSGTLLNTVTNGVSGPASNVAFDNSSNIFLVNGLTELELNSSASTILYNQNPAGFMNGLVGPLVIDSAGTQYAMNSGASTVGKMVDSTDSGTNLSVASFSAPTSIAIDGAGHLWVVNAGSTYGNLTEMTNSGTAISPASTGFLTNGGTSFSTQPESVALDQAGNAWLLNLNGATGTANYSTVQEYVGIAAPTATFAYGVKNGKVASKP